ncbi:MAG: FAD:protein FMN transferase [Planctomycetota bacterium]|nr:FAD:protein FMN transferase [Planctomycetota bacterium]
MHSAWLAGSSTLAVVGPVAVFLASPASASDYLSEAEALASFFPGATSIERELALVDDPEGVELRGGRTPRHLFRHVARKGDELLGYAVVDEVLGKARPITYMLAVDASGAVLGIEVLVYRESHGHEISRAAFRRQFEGKRSTDKLKLDKDIRNISGATISCRAITDGVADLLTVMLHLPAAEVPGDVVPDPAPTAGAAAELPATDEAPAGQLLRTQVVMNAPLTIALTKQGATRAELVAASDAAFAEVRRLEALLSVFVPTSDIARVNAGAGGPTLAVQPETAAVVAQALALAERTGGAFDPAAGALTRLVKTAGESPSESSLAAARSQSGWPLVELTCDPAAAAAPTLRLARRGAALDLGASAKGFSLDRLALLLEQHGISAGLLNFGGQVLVLGEAAVPIEDRGAFAPVQLRGGSLATTGDGERAVADARGAKRSHLVDPRTGQAVPVHGAVQVFAPSAVEADALSTALYVLGPEAAWTLCLEQGIAARFELEPSDAGDALSSPTERCTPAWTRRFPTER